MYPAQSSKLYNQKQHAEGQRLFNQSAGIVFALLMPTIVGSAIVAQSLIAIIAPAEFASGAQLLPIIVAGYAIDLLASYFAVSLGLVYRQYWTTLSLICACLINLVLNLLLIPSYGATGAAIATLVAFTAHFLICFSLSRLWRVYTTSLKFVLKILAASLFMGALIYPLQLEIRTQQFSPVIELAISATAGALVYISVLMISGVLSPRLIATSASQIFRRN
jgi:O-antigen/teichoic acid export membrane protein